MKRLSLILALTLAGPGWAAQGPARIGTALPALPASAMAGAAAARPAAPLSTLPAAIAAPAAPAAIAAAPAPSAADASAQPLDLRLQSLFAELDARYPLPAFSTTAGIRARVRAQLISAAREYDKPEGALLETVAREADRALVRIQKRLDAGEIDPSRRVRVSAGEAEIAGDGSQARVGVYPVAADPFQWGHLLIALRAVGDLGLDRVVFVLAGDDPRKPNMTPVASRHPMGREVLAAFEPFFEYSPIAVGTTLDGETNIFRLLALNPARRVEAWYMVGDDHYRLVDKKGNPDTLPKLERNYAAEMGHSRTLHQLKVAFIKRESQAEPVPTSLEVRFLDHVGFDASSTQARGGRLTLMPFAAYDYARRNGLYGLGAAPSGD